MNKIFDIVVSGSVFVFLVLWLLDQISWKKQVSQFRDQWKKQIIPWLLNQAHLPSKTDQKGQGIVEFALLLVLVVIVIVAVMLILNPAIGQVFSSVAKPLNNNIPWWTISTERIVH